MEEKATILAVDDTEDNLDLLEFALKRKPIRMLRATSGAECLSLAGSELPDVILLDIQMPVMDGFETLKHLRSNPRTAKIPVIVLTAQKKDPESIEKGLLLGADEYLTKPIDIDELLVRTRTLVRLKKAEAELDKTKAEFMAMLVHDLRAPMSGIEGVLDFIADEVAQNKKLEDDHMQLLSSAQMSVSKMLDLINELLDLSRYEAGSINLERKATDIPDLVRSTLKQLELQFQNKGITVKTHYETPLPSIDADPAKMSQVLMNLLSNAYKFTNSGGSVVVSAQPLQNGNNSFVELEVSNTGVGIKPDELPTIFSMYKQASSARVAKERGTGLGLTICKLIVEAHGGCISAESDPGKITTFRMTLPIAP